MFLSGKIVCSLSGKDHKVFSGVTIVQGDLFKG